MVRLRSSGAQRVVAALLLASLLPVPFVSAMQAAHPTTSYADWLLTQLRDPDDGAVAEALAHVEASTPRSLEAFLYAFIAAYEAQQPGTRASRVLAGVDLSTDALVTYLESRYMGVVGDAVMPRLGAVAAPGATGPAMERGAASQAVPPRIDRYGLAEVVVRQGAAHPLFVLPVRAVFAAQPLGP